MSSEQRRPSRERAASADWALYFITDTALAGGPDQVVQQVRDAIDGGAHVIQVRDKHLDDATFRDLAAAVAAAAREKGEEVGRRIDVFVNDRVGIAAELGLHVHVGQGDEDPAAVREAVGPAAMIGVSCSRREHLEAAIAAGHCDVVGLGPVWATPTKTDADVPLGTDGLAALAARAHEAGLKAVAIGGVTARTAADVAATGVDGACVVSAIAGSDDPALAATFVRREFVMNQPLE